MLLIDHVETLREAVGTIRQSNLLGFNAFVVLPDHLHAVWTPPPGDCDFSNPLGLNQESFCQVVAEAGTALPVRKARGNAASGNVASDPR
jgi:REP-associated tyrosine transposase